MHLAIWTAINSEHLFFVVQFETIPAFHTIDDLRQHLIEPKFHFGCGIIHRRPHILPICSLLGLLNICEFAFPDHRLGLFTVSSFIIIGFRFFRHVGLGCIRVD